MELTAVQWLRGTAVRHPHLLDAMLGVAVTGPAALAAIAAVPHHPRPSMTTAGLAAIVLACLVITGRRRWPFALLAVTGAAAIGSVAVARAQQPALLLALAILTYTYATRIDRRTAWLVAGVLALALCGGGLTLTDSTWWAPDTIGVLASLGMATAIGDATRSRRGYIAEVEQRAHRAEQSREDEARSRVVEERMRIARELHDVVGHHIAVINVQAGAAGHVLDRQPEAARDALEHIRRASDTVLRELSAVVAVLRQADDPDLTTEPVTGLVRLPTLLETLRATGLQVAHQQSGDTRDLPTVVDLAVYRIVQEALTNAHKHGNGTACLTIGYHADLVTVEVTNPVAAGVSVGTGYGIVGMRERAAATDGTLTTETTPDRRFLLRATLPAPAGRPQP